MRRRRVGFHCRGFVRQVLTDRARRAIRELVVENLRSGGVGIVLSRRTDSAGSSRRSVSAGGAEDARSARRIISCRTGSARVCGVAGRSSRTRNSADTRTVGVQCSRCRRVAQTLPPRAARTVFDLVVEGGQRGGVTEVSSCATGRAGRHGGRPVTASRAHGTGNEKRDPETAPLVPSAEPFDVNDNV